MRVGLMVGALFALVGCTERSLWYLQGVSIDQRNRDVLACEVQATRDAPVATQLTQGPQRFIPATSRCHMEYLNGFAHREVCVTQPARWEAGDITSVDVNAGLRKRVYAQCLADKGYQRISLPKCDTTPAQVSTRLPHLTEASCAVDLGERGLTIAP